MSNNLAEIQSRILTMVEDFISVQKVYLFGSQIEEYSRKSDIDILIIVSSRTAYTELLPKIVLLSNQINQLIHPVILTVDEFAQRKEMKTFTEGLMGKMQLIFERNARSTNI